MHDAQRGDAGADRLEKGQCVAFGRHLARDHEFLAADPKGEIVGRPGSQRRADLPQHQVAGGMTVTIVVALEMIDIDAPDRADRAVLDRLVGQAPSATAARRAAPSVPRNMWESGRLNGPGA